MTPFELGLCQIQFLKNLISDSLTLYADSFLNPYLEIPICESRCREIDTAQVWMRVKARERWGCENICAR